jgi:hypothetical protein
VSKPASDLNFSPFTVLLGIISGTVISIAFGLSVVCLVFWILRNEEPRLLAEVDSLLLSTGIFVFLSLFAALSFYGSLKRIRWRHIPMTVLWLSLLLTGQYFWPA